MTVVTAMTTMTPMTALPPLAALSTFSVFAIGKGDLDVGHLDERKGVRHPEQKIV